MDFTEKKLKAEIWKFIPDTNECYEASNLGRIRRVPTWVVNNVNGTKRLLKNTILSQKTKSNGYKEVTLYFEKKNNLGKTKYVHRLIVSTFIREIPHGYVVNHKDGDKSNNELYNLEIVTYSENSEHSVRILGNAPPPPKYAQDSHFTKLSNEEVRFIKAHYIKGASNKDLFEMFKNKIGISGFRKICYGIGWNI